MRRQNLQDEVRKKKHADQRLQKYGKLATADQRLQVGRKPESRKHKSYTKTSSTSYGMKRKLIVCSSKVSMVQVHNLCQLR